MHTVSSTRKSLVALGTLAAALALPASSIAQTTGFNQTAAGTYDYNTGGNWVGGTINGIWDSSLTVAGTQTVTFGADTILSTGLNVGYTGNFDLTFQSDGLANRTITLGGDLTISPVSNRTITFGSLTANTGLNVNLGGDRTFTVPTSKALRFFNSISGGNITLDGTTGIAAGGTMRLMGTTGAATSSTITITRDAILVFDSSVSGNTGTTRAQGVTLSGGILSVTGNSGANSVDSISGALTSSGDFGTYNIVSLTPNGTRNAQLTAGSLVRSNFGITLFRGTNLGINTIASATANNSNISFATDLTSSLVGGGGATGTTTISILKGAIGGTTNSDNGSTFVTYTTANGIRPLDVSEFTTSITSGTSTTNNVRLTGAGSLATINSATTINSLIFNPVTSAATIDGTGVLTVTSGQVLLDTTNVALATTINVGLNFGSAEGVIGSTFNRTATINGPVSGTGGLTFYNLNGAASNNTGGASVTGTGHTYTGDTHVLGRLAVNSTSDFLPSATRTGNVFIHQNGSLVISSGNYTINGLNGDGRITYGSSGGGFLTIGDNNASGNFSGIITLSNGGTGGLTKIGSGTQILTGINSYKGVTAINGGVLSVNTIADGGVTSSLGNGTNAAANIVVNNGTLRYTGAATSSDRLFTNGVLGGTLDASGTGALTFTNAGNNVSSEAGNRGGTRTSGSNIVTGVSNFADLTVGARVIGTGITTGTTITAINTGTGEITLSANATAASAANMSFATDRTLALTGSNTGGNTISGVLANSANAGALSVSKSGAGTWVLGATNTYTGSTTVSGGKLTVSGSIASSATTVGSGATFALSGSGTAGAVTVNSGTFQLGTAGTAGAVAINSGTFGGSGTVSSLAFTGTSVFGPGNSAGTVSIADGGSFSLDSGTVSTFQFTDGGFGVGTFDLVTTSGTATGTIAGTLNLDFTGSGYTAGTSVIFVNLSSITGTFSTINVTGLSGLTATVNYNNAAGDISLSLATSSVPEPSTYALFAGAGVLLLAFGRRKRSA
jgi:autotransporter-associated beta strand protein